MQLTFPEKVWLIWPDDGGAPVLWLKPCPFPVEDGQVTEYHLGRAKSQELFKLNEQQAVQCNPGGRFHGWLFRRHPDGQWISERKLEQTEIPNPFIRQQESKGNA